MMARRQKYDAAIVLAKLGFKPEHAESLLRIANRLHRWHELECGTDRGAIERNEETGKLSWYDNRTLKWVPYLGEDVETNSLRKLKTIMANYPEYGYYVQGDPRGCSLYILRPGDVPEGKSADAYYVRGIAVYKE